MIPNKVYKLLDKIFLGDVGMVKKDGELNFYGLYAANTCYCSAKLKVGGIDTFKTVGNAKDLFTILKKFPDSIIKVDDGEIILSNNKTIFKSREIDVTIAMFDKDISLNSSIIINDIEMKEALNALTLFNSGPKNKVDSITFSNEEERLKISSSKNSNKKIVTMPEAVVEGDFTSTFATDNIMSAYEPGLCKSISIDLFTNMPMMMHYVNEFFEIKILLAPRVDSD